MTKTELINAVLKKYTACRREHIENIINHAFKEIGNALGEGGKVQIVGFGTFEVVDKNPREGRNPRTGEKIFIPARKAIHFSAGKPLKATVNQ